MKKIASLLIYLSVVTYTVESKESAICAAGESCHQSTIKGTVRLENYNGKNRAIFYKTGYGKDQQGFGETTLERMHQFRDYMLGTVYADEKFYKVRDKVRVPTRTKNSVSVP